MRRKHSPYVPKKETELAAVQFLNGDLKIVVSDHCDGGRNVSVSQRRTFRDVAQRVHAYSYVVYEGVRGQSRERSRRSSVVRVRTKSTQMGWLGSLITGIESWGVVIIFINSKMKCKQASSGTYACPQSLQTRVS